MFPVLIHCIHPHVLINFGPHLLFSGHFKAYEENIYLALVEEAAKTEQFRIMLSQCSVFTISMLTEAQFKIEGETSVRVYVKGFGTGNFTNNYATDNPLSHGNI